MSVAWMEYKNKKILFGDYRGLKKEELVDNLLKVVAEVRKSPTPVLVLENYTGCFVDKAFMDKGKAFGQELHSKIKKMVYVGVLGDKLVGMKMILIQAFINFAKINLKLFEDEHKALEYLVQD